jgi:hypothetical protein
MYGKPLLEVPKFVQRYKVPIPRYESRPTADGHGTRTDVVDVTGEWVTVEIDLTKIVNFMGRKAVANRGGKSSDGYVTVTHNRPRGRKAVARG